MQLTPRYLVKNRTLVISNEVGFVTEYRPVYQRELQVYRGIDNRLEFQVLNADQKPVQLAGKKLVFVAFDSKRRMVINHEATTLIANKGLVEVIVTENDILNVKQQYLNYNLYIINEDDTRSLTYADEHFNADAVMYISSTAYPGPIAPQEISNFNDPTGGSLTDPAPWLSDAMSAEPGINGNEAVHTAAVYTTGYEGTVTIEATLENQIDGGTTVEWSEVATVLFDGTETQPTPVNYFGVLSYVRIRLSDDPAEKIEKILIRN